MVLQITKLIFDWCQTYFQMTVFLYKAVSSIIFVLCLVHSFFFFFNILHFEQEVNQGENSWHISGKRFDLFTFDILLLIVIS